MLVSYGSSHGNIQCHLGLPYQEIVELAYQLKIDMRKKEEEIDELDSEVKNMDIKVKELEKDKEEKVGQYMTQLYHNAYGYVIRSWSVIN